MKILIVHDRPEVSGEIHSIIEGMGLDSCETFKAPDYYSARDLLREKIFDLLIIDLTLPLADGKGAASYEYADQILDELFNRETLNVPGDVIGITRDQSVLDVIENKIGRHLMVTIEEDSDGKWKGYLQDKITYASRSAQTRYVSVNQHYMYDALIVTAMDKEMQPYRREFEMSDIRHFEGAKEFLFSDSDGNMRKGVAYSIGKSGQPSAASLSQALITFFRPRLAIMSGYCGGVKGKVELGDLVFFEAAYAWDYGKWEEEGTPPESVFRPRPSPISIEDTPPHTIARDYLESNFNRMPQLLDEIGRLSSGRLKKFDMYLRPAASGSAVVANEMIVSRIRGLSDAILAVDMEAYGFYHAAKWTRVAKPAFICVKSVSDFCNGEKEDGLHAACSYISASVVIDLLRGQWNRFSDS